MTMAAASLDSDGTILSRVLAGEKQAYAEIVRRYHDRLRSLLSFYCRSEDDVEEFLQDALVRAYVNLEQYDPARPFFPWLKSIALNRLREEIRHKRLARRHSGEYLRYLQMSRVEDDPDGTRAEARADALRRCLGKLPEPQARLLVAKYREGRTLAELAERVKTSVGALKLRLLRLRRSLRECVEKQLAPADGT